MKKMKFVTGVEEEIKPKLLHLSKNEIELKFQEQCRELYKNKEEIETLKHKIENYKSIISNLTSSIDSLTHSIDLLNEE